MTETLQDVAYRNTVADGQHHGSRGRPRSDRVHRAILDAARELLIRDGYTRLRLEHVAAAAGVGKATIYRRWPSKEDLAQALVQDLAAPHLTIDDVGDTRAEMLAAVLNPMKAITETNFGPVIKALVSQIAGNPKLGDPFRETVVQTRRDEVAKMIARGIERGDLRPDLDPDVATELLVGPIYFRLIFGGDLDDEFADKIVDNVFRGYGEKSGEPRPARADRPAAPGPEAAGATGATGATSAAAPLRPAGWRRG